MSMSSVAAPDDHSNHVLGGFFESQNHIHQELPLISQLPEAHSKNDGPDDEARGAASVDALAHQTHLRGCLRQDGNNSVTVTLSLIDNTR